MEKKKSGFISILPAIVLFVIAAIFFVIVFTCGGIFDNIAMFVIAIFCIFFGIVTLGIALTRLIYHKGVDTMKKVANGEQNTFTDFVRSSVRTMKNLQKTIEDELKDPVTKCPSCGASVEEDEKYCKYCGKKLR